MENVKREGSHESVAQSVLLVQVSGNGTRFLIPPGSPLINEQADASLGIFLVHDGLVLLDHLFNLQAFAQRPVVLVVVEFGGRALRTIPSRASVVVETDSLHSVADPVHQHGCPVVVIVAGTGCNTIEVVFALVAKIGVKLAVLVGIVFRRHVAAASPCLVADTEVFYVPCLLSAVLTAKAGHRRVTVAGHILHPLCHFFHRAGTDISADIGFAAQHLAEVQELVGTERVVFDGAAPVIVAK